jgi:hypothetical protein|tara:strand:+ start:60 stop:1067 length:1008 start_codon:yes stop_codon:yes gene_type:complete
MGLCSTKVGPAIAPVQNTVINIQGRQYKHTDIKLFPIGFAEMINNPDNHVPVLDKGGEGAIVVVGSGWHKASEFIPTLKGVTLDIKGDYNAEDAQGKIVFATADQVIQSVQEATKLKIRKDPLKDDESPEADEKRATRLQEYKTKFITWITSMATEDLTKTTLTFIRNVYHNNGTTPFKPSWMTGLGVDSALDCGSGRVALVSGSSGVVIANGENWATNAEDERWTSSDIQKQAQLLSAMCVGVEAVTLDADHVMLAYATGNWRKEHMQSTVKPFQDALKELFVDFKVLPAELEAKFGSISSLQCAAPYDPTTKQWAVVELGGGSTQICRMEQIS